MFQSVALNISSILFEGYVDPLRAFRSFAFKKSRDVKLSIYFHAPLFAFQDFLSLLLGFMSFVVLVVVFLLW